MNAVFIENTFHLIPPPPAFAYNGTWRKYYFAGASRIAARTCAGSGTTACSAPTFFLSDHLGSTSVSVSMNGEKTSEILYKPWGEVRSASSATASLPTPYTFTGQFSYMDDPTTTGTTEGFGLLFYNARWYDPLIGRFAQADTIIPPSQGVQAWDRFAYTSNNPVRFTDPTGHRCVEGEFEGSCAAVELKMTKKYVVNSTRSDFEKKALLKLSKAGKAGKDIFEYIVLNNVKIDFKWTPYAGAVWDKKENAVYLNSGQMDPDKTDPESPWVLNLIAHEATHLQGGSTWALSKVGELEAWKVGFAVQDYFAPLDIDSPEYDIVHNLEIWDTDTFTELVHEYNNNAGGAGAMYDFMFDLFLPAWPIGIQI